MENENFDKWYSDAISEWNYVDSDDAAAHEELCHMVVEEYQNRLEKIKLIMEKNHFNHV